ncbi:MAG: hypothetical protein WBV22_11375 [Anaerolineaceae bacterium]
MEELNPNSTQKSRQSPVQRHLIQSLWQIWLPLGVVVLLVVGFFIASLIITQSGSTDLGQVQNAAVILMILPLAFIGVMSFIALGLAIFGTSRIFAFVPRLRMISLQLDSISFAITNWSNRLMLPFVLVRGLRNRLTSKKHRQLLD